MHIKNNCLKRVCSTKKQIAKKIETINSNVNEITAVSKSEIEIEKANELLGTPREYIE